jgi:hypothetical protein
MIMIIGLLATYRKSTAALSQSGSRRVQPRCPIYRDEPKLSARTSELAGNQLHLFVACLVIRTGSKRFLIGDDGTIGFVNPQKLPSG